MRYIIESKVLNWAPKSVSILHAAKTIMLQSCDVENATEDTILGTGHYLLGGGRKATKLRKSLAKKLWPTPIKGLTKIDPPKTQIKKL